MHRYALCFEKKGRAVYCSHLDMMRFFKRAFHRAGVPLSYSQGYHPHPKMSFAQPLSLGYEGLGEYLEFRSEEAIECEGLLREMNENMPEGLRILSCEVMPESGPGLASLCKAADYRIRILWEEAFPMKPEEVEMEGFLAREEILVEKRGKKGKGRRQMVTLDIRPMIHSLRWEVGDKEIIMYTNLDCGSGANLSPQVFLKAWEDYLGFAIPPERLEISRLRMFFDDPSKSE